MEDAIEVVDVELIEKIGRKSGKIVVEVNCNNELLMKRLQRELQIHDRYACSVEGPGRIVIFDTLGGDLRIDEAKKIIMSVVENIKSLKREKITVYV